MERPVTLDEALNFRTVAGGARPSTPEEQALVPAFDVEAFRNERMTAARTEALAGGSNLERYDAAYPRDINQAWSGICTECGVLMAAMGYAACYRNQPMEFLSAYFGYTQQRPGDGTFLMGGSGVGAADVFRLSGMCLDSLYSQDYVNSFPGGTIFTGGMLPSPAAYADAAKRKLLSYSRLAWWGRDIDLALLDQILRSGRWVSGGMGNHYFAIGEVAADGSFYKTKDSERADIDYGYGRGIRAYMRDAMPASNSLLVIEAVQDGTGAGGVGVPSLVEFGSVPVGTTVRKVCLLTNLTAAPILATITSDNPAFTVPIPTIGAGAGRDGMFLIDFKPTAVGQITGQGKVVHDGPGSPQFFELSGTGTGVAPPPPPPPPPDPVAIALTNLLNARAILGVAMPDIPAAVAAINVALAALGGTVVTPPPPPPPPPPGGGNTINYDDNPPKQLSGQGHTWGFGAVNDPRDGKALVIVDLGNRSAGTSCKLAKEVGGIIYYQDPRNPSDWYKWNGDPYAQVKWTQTTAP